MRTFLITAALALALPATAAAGGWATAGLGPPPPGIGAGDTWTADVTILQHGQTPLAGLSPTVTIRNATTGEVKTFRARPTGKIGSYRAEVVFPSGGTWRYEVYDGFTEYGGAKTHKFAAVEIAGGGGAGGSSSPAWTIGGSTALALALAGMILIARRRSAESGIATEGAVAR